METIGLGHYLEDLSEGRRFRTVGRTVTETDIVNFINTIGMTEVLFTNTEFLHGEAGYEGRLAPGSLVFCFVEGLLAQSAHQGTGLAFLGMDLKILRPTFAGDTIHVEVEVLESRPSETRPGRGIVRTSNKVVNQRDEMVMQYTPVRMIKRRAEGLPDERGHADRGQARCAGVRVVDLTVNVLGPLATMILGDLGADVIKVETPSGDPNRRTGPSRHPNMSAMHMNINRSKRSVTLDLKRPASLAALFDLIETRRRAGPQHAHLRGAPARHRLRERRRAPSRASSTATRRGYMPGSSRENDPAFDDVLQGESGIADLMLKSVGQARYLPTVMVDKFCGHALASAVGMALFARERTGLGQQVCVPMFETLVAFNLQEHLWGAAFDPPLGAGIGYVRLLSAHRRPYETRDSHICVLAVTDEQWTAAAARHRPARAARPTSAFAPSTRASATSTPSTASSPSR